MSIIVRQYGLLDPLNWEDDCFEHLYLQNKLWNRLVEIEQDNRNKYRVIMGSDKEVAIVQTSIETIKARIAEMDIQRKNLRILHRKKSGTHTEPLDEAIKSAKIELKELAVRAKEIRTAAKGRIKELVSHLEPERNDAVKLAYNTSGLWWSNYNAVVNSYNTARKRAMKEGAELRFHRFDGSGRFTCQIMDGMSTGDLLSGRHSIAQIRKVSCSEFTEIIKSNPPAIQLQSVGSRRNEREYGVLSITVYTGEYDHGKKTRRILDFPLIIHRPLPEATLKTLVVNRRKIGLDFRWLVTLTFSSEINESIEHASKSACGINLGWKQVEGGLRVATISDGTETRHVILPQVIIDKLSYTELLQSRIDIATNENYAWLLGRIENPPDILMEDMASFRRAKRPHPAKFAKFVIKWRTECPDFEPQALAAAEVKRKMTKRLSQEHHHLRDKVLRRRLELYRNEAKKIADKYGLIKLDKMDLSRLAVLEKEDSISNKLSDIARYHRKVAALSEFREWIVKQSLKVGGTVVMIAMESTRTCYCCGGAMVLSGGLFMKCRECGNLADQDENASINLLRAAVQ